MTSSKKRTAAKKQPSATKKTVVKRPKTVAKKTASKKAVAPKKASTAKAKKVTGAKPRKAAKPSAKAKSTNTSAAKKTGAKQTTPKPTVKKAPAGKATKPAKKAKPAKKPVAKAQRPPKTSRSPKIKKAVDSSAAANEAGEPEADPKTKSIVLGARRRKGTPAVFKTGPRKNTPIVFSLEDVHEILRQKENNGSHSPTDNAATDTPAKDAGKQTAEAAADKPAPQTKKRVLGAASLADILGFDPSAKNSRRPEGDVPRKWAKYHRLLMELRDHVRDELDIHTQQTLKRSAKDDAGDLSGYGQHMADAGTDTFDRDFALSLVSNEQEALYEISEAIKRIHAGTYGVCEITGQPINRERLAAVPFTRYSLEGQRELEKNKRRTRNRGEIGVFADTDDSSVLANDDDSDS